MAGMTGLKKWGLADQTHAWLWMGLLSLAVLALYAPSIRFGLIWDDPKWYAQAASVNGWELFAPMPAFRFYRPIAILLSRLLVNGQGVVNAPVGHVIQVGAHLLAVWLSPWALRASGLEMSQARLAALIFAVYPLSFQAVAWPQALQTPLALAMILLAALLAHAFRRARRLIWLALSAAAYAAALLLHESALPFVFLFFWLAARDRRAGRRMGLWPLLHLALGGAYLAVWISLPRQSDPISAGFQPLVLGYLLQGVAFPVARLWAGSLLQWRIHWLIALFAGVWLILALGVWRWNSARAAGLSSLWIAAGLLPVWAGLSWPYVEIGSRLIYPASLGIAVLWGGWAAWVFARGQPLWRRGLGGLALIGVLTLSLQEWRQNQQLYEAGTAHLERAASLLAASPNARLLFVNFPDRIEIRPPLYPLGFWGITLAPVIQDLSDYARASTGRSAEDRSLSAILTGADGREAWPYRVDLRGPDSSPATLFEGALWADAVYLTDYLPGGTLGLRNVGEAQRSAEIPAILAQLGDAVQLVGAETSNSADTLTIRLGWKCLKPLTWGDTVFVHFWQEGVFSGAADNDSLGGLIPLNAWEPGATIIDVRHVSAAQFAPGEYEVRVGLYNRDSGERFPAFSGLRRWPEDEVTIATVVMPPAP